MVEIIIYYLELEKRGLFPLYIIGVEIKFLFILFRILLRIIFTQMNLPLAAELILLIQTSTISLISRNFRNLFYNNTSL